MWSYFKSRDFLKMLAVLLAGGVVLLLLLFYVFFPVFTRHGDSVPVPQVQKLNVEEASVIINDAGLEAVVADSQYLPDLPALAVITQDPFPQTKVKPGRKIYLVVNKAVPPMIRFPKVRNFSLHQGKTVLESWGLGIGKLIFVNDFAQNTILRTSMNGKEIKEGDKVQVGSRIDLTISRGLGNEMVAVPELLNMNVGDAISLLNSSGLNVGVIRYDPLFSAPPGIVFGQNPKYLPGDSVVKGFSVDLMVAGSAPEEPFEAPFPESTDSTANSN